MTTLSISNPVAIASIGNVVFHRFGGNTLKASQVVKAFESAGLDPDEFFIQETSASHAFSVACGDMGGPKVTYETEAGVKRQSFLLLLDRNADEVVYALNVSEREGNRKNNVGQIGHIELDLHTEVVTWAFTDLTRSQGEDDDAYAARKIATLVPGGRFDAMDITKAVGIFQASIHRFFRRANLVDNDQMHRLVKKVLDDRRMHTLPLKPRGGVYFVPNLPGQAFNPADHLAKVAKVIEGLNPGNALYLLPQIDGDAVRATADAAEETLTSKVAGIMGKLETINQIKSKSQVAAQAAKIREVMQTAKLYRDLVGLQSSELTEAVAKASEKLTGMTQEYEKTKEQTKAAKAEAKAQAKRKDEVKARLEAAGIPPEKIDEVIRESLADRPNVVAHVPAGVRGWDPRKDLKAAKDAAKTKAPKKGAAKSTKSQDAPSEELRTELMAAFKTARKMGSVTCQGLVNGDVSHVNRKGYSWDLSISGAKFAGQDTNKNRIVGSILTAVK